MKRRGGSKGSLFFILCGKSSTHVRAGTNFYFSISSQLAPTQRILNAFGLQDFYPRATLFLVDGTSATAASTPTPPPTHTIEGDGETGGGGPFDIYSSQYSTFYARITLSPMELTKKCPQNNKHFEHT